LDKPKRKDGEAAWWAKPLGCPTFLIRSDASPTQPRKPRGYAGLWAHRKKKEDKPGWERWDRTRRTFLQKRQLFTRFRKHQFSTNFLVF
jgi:hypothetical protein